MGIGERWQRWWDRLTHGEAAAGREPSGRDAVDRDKARPEPGSARALGQVPTEPNGEFKLAVDPKKRSIPHRGRVGSAGFDPYSNDAGYEKPGNWDKVDPR